jgi:hypothetical protein
MLYNIEDHLDCGEVNSTKLAENACQEFELYENDNDATIPEWLFELSVKVAEYHDKVTS